MDGRCSWYIFCEVDFDVVKSKRDSANLAKNVHLRERRTLLLASRDAVPCSPGAHHR
jgi:hypothetical protein